MAPCPGAPTHCVGDLIWGDFFNLTRRYELGLYIGFFEIIEMANHPSATRLIQSVLICWVVNLISSGLQ